MYFSKKLEKFKGVRHCFFSRKNGFSKGKYKGLNCGTPILNNYLCTLKIFTFLQNILFFNLFFFW